MSNEAELSLEVPDCVPSRMLNEYAYCARLGFLEWVETEFSDNFETTDGRYQHRVVDQEKGKLPDEITDTDRIHARSVLLSSPEEHLTAKIDLIENEGNFVIPVDYKRSTVPNLPERAWEPDRIQVCAQGLVLRANGYQCDFGILYYIASKTRVEVPFDSALIERTRSLVREMRQVAQRGVVPPPLKDSPKCVRCSLAGICLPDETNWLRTQVEIQEASPDNESVRRLIPARDDCVPLYVQEQGAKISKKGEVFEVFLKEDKLNEARMFELSQISLFGSIQITTQALQEALNRDIPVAFFTSGGWFYGLAQGMTHKNVLLRLEQYKTALSPERALALARDWISSKIDNCRTLLLRNHPELPEPISDRLKQSAKDATSASTMATLLGVEGNAAKLYFSAFGGMLKEKQKKENAEPPSDFWNFDFNGRNRRPPLDPINALLSFAYTLLVKEFTITLLMVGFDPFLGMYHQPRYGRPALALDMMEEFRPVIADSVVLNVVNNGIITPQDFIKRGKSVALKPEARKKFISTYEKRMDTLITHPVFGYKISYRRVLEVQARLLGRVFTKEISQYPVFKIR